jgi:hypothetical protein
MQKRARFRITAAAAAVTVVLPCMHMENAWDERRDRMACMHREGLTNVIIGLEKKIDWKKSQTSD